MRERGRRRRCRKNCSPLGRATVRQEGKLWLLETWTVSRAPCLHLSQQGFVLAHQGPSLQERPSRLQHVGLEESKVTEGPGLFTVALPGPRAAPPCFQESGGGAGNHRVPQEGSRWWLCWRASLWIPSGESDSESSQESREDL